MSGGQILFLTFFAFLGLGVFMTWAVDSILTTMDARRDAVKAMQETIANQQKIIADQQRHINFLRNEVK